jgi:hypothetical protein
MIGRSAVLAEVIVTLPRDNGVMRTLRMVA